LRELGIRALEEDWRRQERQQQAEDQRRRWEATIGRARHDFREAFRADVLTGQWQRRQLVREIDDFLSEMRVAVAVITGE
jgi:hypothetical protein